jgi:hypothetical protein
MSAIAPSITPQPSLADQFDACHSIAALCEGADGQARESLVRITPAKARALRAAAITLDVIMPVADEVRAVVMREKRRGEK